MMAGAYLIDCFMLYAVIHIKYAPIPQPPPRDNTVPHTIRWAKKRTRSIHTKPNAKAKPMHAPMTGALSTRSSQMR